MAATDPKALLLSMQQSEYETFQNDYLPMLEQYQKDINTRRADYNAAAVQDTASLAALQQNTAATKRSELGVALTADQAQNQGRKNALNLSQATALAQNKAVDTADQVNLDTASKLADVTTGMRNQAISNASSASGMASARATTGANNKAAASAQNTQMAGTAVATIAIMI